MFRARIAFIGLIALFVGTQMSTFSAKIVPLLNPLHAVLNSIGTVERAAISFSRIALPGITETILGDRTIMERLEEASLFD